MWRAEDATVYEFVGADQQRRALHPGGRLTIGRHADNDLVVDNGSVSRFHARIDWEAGTPAPTVVDLGSLNGTFIGGVRVLRSPLGEWTRLRVGSVEITGSLRHPALIPATGSTMVRMFDEWSRDEEGTVEAPLGVQELLLTLERARRTVTVDVKAEDLAAVVVLAGGRVVQATVNELTGLDALRRLVAHPGRARYVISADVDPCEGGAPLSVRDLLREARTRRATPPRKLLAS